MMFLECRGLTPAGNIIKSIPAVSRCIVVSSISLKRNFQITLRIGFGGSNECSAGSSLDCHTCGRHLTGISVARPRRRGRGSPSDLILLLSPLFSAPPIACRPKSPPISLKRSDPILTKK